MGKRQCSNKELDWLPKGSSVRVLEVTRKTYTEALSGQHKMPYAECRVVNEGRDLGKEYVPLFDFNDSEMKPAKQ